MGNFVDFALKEKYKLLQLIKNKITVIGFLIDCKSVRIIC